jgi:hypothetical protein
LVRPATSMLLCKTLHSRSASEWRPRLAVMGAF